MDVLATSYEENDNILGKATERECGTKKFGPSDRLVSATPSSFIENFLILYDMICRYLPSAFYLLR